MNDLIGRCIEATAVCVRDNADLLTRLDQAIGDGDHGVNMRRGFDALDEQREQLAGLTPGEALRKAGMTLVMKVGGASGPIYGSLLMAMQNLPERPQAGDLADALQAGIEAVGKRGKAQPGDKTLLDVLVPVHDTLRAGLAEGLTGAPLAGRVKQTAAEALAATAPMRARRGRAAFLGERSVGHLDPGAQSAQLLLDTLCDQLVRP